MFVYCGDARRVPRGAVQGRAEPRPGHAVRVVAQSVHGLRPPLHLLLRPGVRATRRPALRRPLRHVDPREGERRRRAARRARRRSWDGGAIAIGAATDPYQPAEGRYRLTRACIEVLRDAANPFSIITRGPLIVRDVDVLAEAARRDRVSRHLLGPDARRGRLADDGARDRAAPAATARAAHARRGRRPRLGRHGADPARALRPPTADRREVVAAREAGACGIWANLLYLRPGTREHFLDCLARDWPELLPGVRARCTRAAPTSHAGRSPGTRARRCPCARARDPRPATGASCACRQAAEQLSLF